MVLSCVVFCVAVDWQLANAEDYIKRDDNGVFWCAVCGQRGSHKHHLTRHVEAKHLQLTFNCQVCGETFNARYALQAHVRRVHKMGSRAVTPSNV